MERNAPLWKMVIYYIIIIYIVGVVVWVGWDYFIIGDGTRYTSYFLLFTILAPLIAYKIFDFVKSGEIKGVIKRSKSFFNDITVFGFAFGYPLSLIFLFQAATKLETLLTLTGIYFTLAAFSFTAGSFYHKKDGSDFFKTSLLFLLLGLVNLLYYLYFPILDSLKENNIIQYTVAIIVITLAVLFWLSFEKLIRLLFRHT